MPASHSLLSYPDVEKILDQALTQSITVECQTEQLAKVFSARCFTFRRLHRRQAAKLHGPDSLLVGTSQYDILRISRVGRTLTISKYDDQLMSMVVKPVGEASDPDQPDAPLNKNEPLVE